MNLDEKPLEVGDYASAGPGYVGRIEKIIECTLYEKKTRLCKDCKNEGRKRYIISGQDFCRKIVQKM